MSAPSSPSFASDDERALAELIEAWESGGESAVEVLLAARERELPGLRARFAALRATGLLDEPERRIDSFPERLGEFRLLARLGGGGMGVVYRARQESLGRDVALKLVRPDELYFPGARERFEREVRITAALSHPGIVPVYAHGDEQGIPFFAMELVDGASLEDVLQSLRGAHPSQLCGADLFRAAALRAPPAGPAPERERLARLDWPRTVAELGLAAARALAHAHEHGVLHRDVKPSNLLLARDGRLLVADFGLASSSAASKLTRTRSQMGSLPYLAPELLAGGAASPRSDVYGLCVTLYELAALRPPYWNTDTVVLRDAILRGDALPLRRLEAGVPADLAAVIELGMDADPARRYASHAELVADLENALAHRPVRARPAGPLLVAQRWVARHPTRAVALAAAALVALGAPSLVAWQQSRLRERERGLNEQLSGVNSELTRVNGELARSLGAEQASRASAERHFGEARDAVMTLLTRVAGEPTFREPALEPLRRDLYERALEFQERFLAEAE
ncbi:MAG: serine/threonine protein kinase, partial [Planctomycetota bacterium]